MNYFLLKLIHILSSTLLFGTGLGSAFYFWRANQSKNIHAMYFAAKNVVIADWLFTTPSVIIQPITGILLMQVLGVPFSANWIVLALILYAIIGACWLPVVWLQIKMRDMLAAAVNHQTELPILYYHYYRAWFILGWPAFIGVIIIFYLMVFK